MGHFLASRCALYRLGPDGLDLAHARGVKAGEAPRRVPGEPAALLRDLRARGAWPSCPTGRSRSALGRALRAGGAARGRGAAERPPRGGGAAGRARLRRGGPRLRGRPGAPDPGRARGRAVRTACASRRRGRTATCRSPAGSSRACFPTTSPKVEGFEVAAVSRSCFQVGGDYYDFIPLEGGRLGLVIADVSGKGTPASLMMASVHAWLRATGGHRAAHAGARAPQPLPVREHADEPLRHAVLRRARPASAAASPTSTPATSRRTCGARTGGRSGSRAGGPVLGLLDDVALEAGELAFEPGDLLAVVTDGVTEALSPGGDEFGDERVRRALAGPAGQGRRGRRSRPSSRRWTPGPGPPVAPTTSPP